MYKKVLITKSEIYLHTYIFFKYHLHLDKKSSGTGKYPLGPVKTWTILKERKKGRWENICGKIELSV